MSLLERLPILLNEAKEEYKAILEKPANEFILTQTIGGGRNGAAICLPSAAPAPQAFPGEGGFRNALALGDNADYMRYLLDPEGPDLAGKLQLVYIDPPFFSKVNYGAEIKLNAKAGIKVPVMRQKAYRDKWENGMEEYLSMLAVRFYLIRDLLSDEGCLWVHLDHHAVHYVKVLLDEIFGEKNFVNEIIWTYKSGGVSKRAFAKKHDNLLFYSKTPHYYFKPEQEQSYNRGYKPYRFKGVKEFRDETGWYTMVNRKDVWTIDMVGRTSSERTGYATQKPEVLMERILASCSREGDLVADFFCGSGTMPAAAEKMHRNWLACDIGRLASINTHKRMVTLGASYQFLEAKDEAEGSKEQGKIHADIRVEDLPLADKKKLVIDLTGYEPASLKNVPVEEKYLPVIRKVIREDSVALVDFWSVSGALAGSTSETARQVSPGATFCREGRHLELHYETLIETPKEITIKAVDIFGNGATMSFVAK